ncbi:microtubule-associated serine/threonine-protein kinase 3-like isoform X2 [Solea solea]|uniref:microtubule-associated serine/threonine-protein kinase 3-like isoform X2 n=1 Tax=Solea solea TaxID=90069 RepID=UPI00272D3932|nr:microtubule-associated serine/threonine-protein kinase 3-like isoform X2 [Solea solea]
MTSSSFANNVRNDQRGVPLRSYAMFLPNLSSHVLAQGESRALPSVYNSQTMYSEAEYLGSDVNQARVALYFIQQQLLELTRECDFILTNNLVGIHFFMELQDKLEKVLHETRAAWNPPVKKPEMSDFEIMNTIGNGGFGTVKVVTHSDTGQKFAMKIIDRQTLTRKIDVKHVLMERDILTFIDNPFIVSLFCAFVTQTELCIVMEHVAGGSCGTLLNQVKVLPVNIARFYTAEVVLALEYLHSFGILHGDLKPENLLLTYTGHIKVADFGLSRIGPVKITADINGEHILNIVQEFTDGLVVGTPMYTAPEMILGISYGKPADWWSVGIILYEFLVGSCPYRGYRFKDVLYDVVTKDITWPQKKRAVPADAQDLITTLLNTDAISRLGTRGAIELKLHPFFQDVEWYNLLDQDLAFYPQEDLRNLVPNYEDQSDTYSESCYTDSINDTTDEYSTSDEEEVTDDWFTFELQYFCSVPYRFKEVYGSPSPLSYTLG